MANPLKLHKLKPTGFQFIEEIPINAPPAKVWAAILNMRNWFYFSAEESRSYKASLEPRLGGRFMTNAADGSYADLHGIVMRIEPEKLLRINGPMGMSHLPVANAMIWELQPRDGGRKTTLRFCQRTFGFLTPDVQKNFRGGWKQLHSNLKALAEGPRQKRRSTAKS